MAVKAAKHVSHAFPGGIFAWKFRDDEPISALKYLSALVKILLPDKVDVIFPRGVPTELTHEEVLKLGLAISEQFKISVLLILDHADTLKRAEAKGERDALALVDLFKNIPIKILATSQVPLVWPKEKLLQPDGLVNLDIDSGYNLFIHSLTIEARERMAKKAEEDSKQNTKQLLHDLVTIMDGHPQSLIHLGRATSQSHYSTMMLKDVVYEQYSTMILQKDLKEKSLKRHFGQKIEELKIQQRLFMYLCSFVTEPITAEALAFVSHFTTYVGETITTEAQEFIRDFMQTTNSRIETIMKNLEQSCSQGYFEKNQKQEYRVHVGFREALQQHNVELKLQLRLPIMGLFDSSFVAGVSLTHGE